MADSKSFVGAKPVPSISASCVSRQLSLVIVAKPVGPCSSITGSAKAFGTPNCVNEGPIPRTITRFGLASETMKALIMTESPVPTNARELRLVTLASGLGVGVGLGVAVGVTLFI